MHEVSALTDGYSGNDRTLFPFFDCHNRYKRIVVANLCKDAAMAPLREAMARSVDEFNNLPLESFRPLDLNDFRKSLQRIKVRFITILMARTFLKAVAVCFSLGVLALRRMEYAFRVFWALDESFGIGNNTLILLIPRSRPSSLFLIGVSAPCDYFLIAFIKQ